METQNTAARIGILFWETGRVPCDLMQLESPVGNSTNPASYDYPVRPHPVRGAKVHTILEDPDPAVLHTMIGDARAMLNGGIRAITNSCGFNVIVQHELAAAVLVPVFTELVSEKWTPRSLVVGHRAGLRRWFFDRPEARPADRGGRDSHQVACEARGRCACPPLSRTRQ